MQNLFSTSHAYKPHALSGLVRPEHITASATSDSSPNLQRMKVNDHEYNYSAITNIHY